MIARDFKITVTCDICKEKYSFFVNKDAYEEFRSEESDKSVMELFPHLMDEEVDLLETNICSNCA